MCNASHSLNQDLTIAIHKDPHFRIIQTRSPEVIRPRGIPVCRSTWFRLHCRSKKSQKYLYFENFLGILKELFFKKSLEWGSGQSPIDVNLRKTDGQRSTVNGQRLPRQFRFSMLKQKSIKSYV